MADPKYDPVLGDIFDEGAQEPIIPSRRLDPRTTGLFSETVHTTIKDIAKDKDASGDIGRKPARVCLVFKKEEGYFDKAVSWVGGWFGLDAEDRLSIIAYCPRVHSMIPDPFAIAKQRKIWPFGNPITAESFAKWEGLISTILPTGMRGSSRFTISSAEAEGEWTPAIGDWVWIEYGDEVNKTNGILLEPINKPGENVAVEAGPPRSAKEAVEEGKLAPPDRDWVKKKHKSPQLRPGHELDTTPPPAPEEVNYLIKGPITGIARFHQKRGGKKHQGTDFYAPEGSQVFSVSDGVVEVLGSIVGYGLTVVVYEKATKKQFLYSHLSNISVSKGPIKKGTLIGHVGSTAHYKSTKKAGKGALNSSLGQFFDDDSPHLHMEVLNVRRHKVIKRKLRMSDREDSQAWLRGEGISEGAAA